MKGRLFLWLVLATAAHWTCSLHGQTQSLALPWSGHGHDPQHSGISQFAAQTMNRVLWQTPVDLAPQYTNGVLYIHYGSPLVTQGNTVLVPVKTGTYGGFRVEAHAGGSGSLVWMQNSDYTLPPFDWVPEFGIALTPKNRVYFPGNGGTVYFRDTPDAAAPSSSGTGQVAFYGSGNYQADEGTYNANVKINTPITSDRYGNIFFGFLVSGSTSQGLQSGIARIAPDLTGTWVAVTTAAADSGITEVVYNCTPALSNDHKTLYAAVSTGDFGAGYLVALDSRTLAPLSRVRLKDVANASNDAILPDEGSSCPTVGPDGDVYFGVLENPFGSNHLRGWLLHFNGTLSQSKTPGAFGWDDSPSIVRASLVSTYSGTSSYLMLSKYNNYAEAGGNGQNKIAILDPDQSMTDPISGAAVMKEVITVLGPTADSEFPNIPGAVREWCINSVAVDPASKGALVNSEDGSAYRWDFGTNTLMQKMSLTSGIGEAYTPTVIGVDGADYIIENAILFAIGQ